MIRAYARRGVAAGLLAGLLAGLVGLLVGTPTIEAAERREHAAAEESHDEDARGRAAPHSDDQADHAEQEALFSRGEQSVGLVAGSALAGAAVGLVFAVAAAWAAGRVRGDGWWRSLKLGVVAVAALVGLPALAYPPLPPGAGDPDTVGVRAALFVATVVLGLALATGGWLLARRLAGTRVLAASRQVLVGLVLVAAAALMIAALPSPASVGATASGLPGELVWRFRLGTLATQVTALAGTAVGFGVLTARAEARTASREVRT